ncbi:MAG: hypothetical protein LBH81_02395 [Rickettsiales bacterium]|jgi:hypothetical protein|nr:hypothetical protein [Rickettsiales bacterium]
MPRIKSELGRFMFEALLMLSLVIAFMPTLLGKLANRALSAENAAVSRQIDSLYAAASAWARENYEKIPLGVDKIESAKINQTFEAYGLPIGWNPRTPLGQDIRVVLLRNPDETIPLIEVSGGALSETRRAEIAQRIGFWGATASDGKLSGATGDWELDTKSAFGFAPAADGIFVRIPLEAEMSEFLARKSRNPEKNAMNADIDMLYNNITGAGSANAGAAEFDAGFFMRVLVSGAEEDKNKNEIESLATKSASFQSVSAAEAPLNVSRGTLAANSLEVRDISSIGGSAANLEVDFISVLDYHQSPGAASFYGPAKWSVGGNAELSNTALSGVAVMNISGVAEITSDSNIFYDDLLTLPRSGIYADSVSAGHITVKDQTARMLSANSDNAPTLVSIRLNGTSQLPDLRLEGINNDGILIPVSAADDGGGAVSCKSLMENLGQKYDSRSLSQHAACLYARYARLEKRIDMKKCLMQGGDPSKCS